MLRVYNRQGPSVFLENAETPLLEGLQAAQLLSTAIGYSLPRYMDEVELMNANSALNNIKRMLTNSGSEPTKENIINFIQVGVIPTENPLQTDIEQ